jgi:hypothetical protein
VSLSDFFQNLDFPSWATTDDAMVFWMGFAVACCIRIIRAGIRWFRRVGSDSTPSE